MRCTFKAMTHVDKPPDNSVWGKLRSLNVSEVQAEFEDTCAPIPHMGTRMPTFTHATHTHEPLTEELCTLLGGICLIQGTLQSLLSHV